MLIPGEPSSLIGILPMNCRPAYTLAYGKASTMRRTGQQHWPTRSADWHRQLYPITTNSQTRRVFALGH